MQILLILFSILITVVLGMLSPVILPMVIILSLLGSIYFFWKQKQKGFKPQSDTYRELEKLKNKSPTNTRVLRQL